MIRQLLRDTQGGGAAEFAVVLPLLILFLFGIIDVGRFAYMANQAEKATQAGARVAIVTQAVPQGLIDYNHVGQTIAGVTYTQGDPIQASALGLVTCEGAGGTVSCVCTTGPCPSLGTTNTNGFNTVVSRMQAMFPGIDHDNVTIEYRGSGLGYAGDPSGMEMSPLVTVRLDGLSFTPLSGLMLLDVALPSFGTTLTAEDSVGTKSN